MPLSTSSKTSVGTGEVRASTTLSASMNRDSSPPEATWASGPGGPARRPGSGGPDGGACEGGERGVGPPAGFVGQALELVRRGVERALAAALAGEFVQRRVERRH